MNWELGIGNWELGIGNWELPKKLIVLAARDRGIGRLFVAQRLVANPVKVAGTRQLIERPEKQGFLIRC